MSRIERWMFMGWRWRNSIHLGGGARSTMTSRGMGVSWGLAGFRMGRSPGGDLWVSFSIPGTGISFFKKLPRLGNQTPTLPTGTQQSQTRTPSPLPQPPVNQLTANQKLLQAIKRTKP